MPGTVGGPRNAWVPGDPSWKQLCTSTPTATPPCLHLTFTSQPDETFNSRPDHVIRLLNLSIASQCACNMTQNSYCGLHGPVRSSLPTHPDSPPTEQPCSFSFGCIGLLSKPTSTMSPSDTGPLHRLFSLSDKPSPLLSSPHLIHSSDYCSSLQEALLTSQTGARVL